MIRYRQGIILLVVLTSAGCVFGMGLNEMIKLGHETVMEVLDAWQKIVLHIPSNRYASSANLVFMKMMEIELHKQIEQVSKNIDEHQERIENKVDTILVQLMQQSPTQRKLEDRLTELDHYIGQVHELYKLFEMYANNSNFEQYTMLQFAKACVSPRLGELPSVLKSIHRIIIPSMSQVHNSSLLVLLARQIKVGI